MQSEPPPLASRSPFFATLDNTGNEMTRAISHSYLGSTATVGRNRYQCHLCLSVRFTNTARRCGECENVA
eukprot:11079161-Karenia_brevis.AAC.1